MTLSNLLNRLGLTPAQFIEKYAIMGAAIAEVMLVIGEIHLTEAQRLFKIERALNGVMQRMAETKALDDAEIPKGERN